MPIYFSCDRWREFYPGVRALILSSPEGRRYLVKKGEQGPIGKFRLLGVIE